MTSEHPILTEDEKIIELKELAFRKRQVENLLSFAELYKRCSKMNYNQPTPSSPPTKTYPTY